MQAPKVQCNELSRCALAIVNSKEKFNDESKESGDNDDKAYKSFNQGKWDY